MLLHNTIISQFYLKSSISSHCTKDKIQAYDPSSRGLRDLLYCSVSCIVPCSLFPVLFPVLKKLHPYRPPFSPLHNSPLLSWDFRTCCCLFSVISSAGASHGCLLLTLQVSVKTSLFGEGILECPIVELAFSHHIHTHRKSFSIIILLFPWRTLMQICIHFIYLYIIRFYWVHHKLHEGRGSSVLFTGTQNRPWYKDAA